MNLDELLKMAHDAGYKEGVRDGRANRVKIKTSGATKAKDKIIAAVSAYYGIPEELMKAKTRKGPVVRSRQVCMTLIKAFTNTALKEIGQEFGGRDHTTVIHAAKKVRDLCDTEEPFNAEVDYLRGVVTDLVLNDLQRAIIPKPMSVAMRKKIERTAREIQQRPKTVIVQTGENFTRPPAIYSNRGHQNIVNEYSQLP